MDDSDQDFVDLCSKLLKRVRRKAGETEKRSVAEPSSQDTAKDIPTKRVTTRRKKKDVGSSSKGALGNNSEHVSSISTTCDEPNRLPSNTDESKQAVVNGGIELGVGENGSPVAVDVAGSRPEDRGMGVKEKVLHRMQQFKRVNPQKLVHGERNQPAATGSESDSAAPHPLPDNEVPSTSASTPLSLDPQVDDSDEALALRLQEELDREAQAVAQGSAVDLEQGGLFFCQLCQKDLSAMSPTGRTQHINRCLDESEDSAAPAPPPAPSVPECPICGKRFKSQKSRAAHLKRCSSMMGVAPAVLLQAVQRQVAEGLTDSTANQPPQAGGSKRKGSTDPSLPGRKKPRKKPRGLDEDTMVAMALSHSLLEQEKEMEREMQREMEREGGQQLPALLPHISLSPLKWRAEPSKTSKGRGKRKRGAPPRPPPLLLVQDSETALRRLQERVAGLLLRTRGPSPPTPKRCPSSLPSCSTGAGPLWQKSALRDRGPKIISEFYTPELREFIQPWVSVKTDIVCSTNAMPVSSTNLSLIEGVSITKQSIPSSQRPVSSTQAAPSSLPSTPGTGHLPVGSQTLCDLMELADEGMTLTQWGYSTPGPTRENTATDFHLSGFVPESTDEPPDLCLSGFIPESIRNTESHQIRSLPQSRDTNRSNQKSVALSRLASDLTSMVNNPQFSDVQLQVDSGEVYFTHSFMLYARCPLLAQMVHDSGFGVQEDGMPSAQRVLLGEVPGQAVYTLLQYLYTAHCPLTHTLLPHVQELAARFNLEELQQLCQLYAAQTDLHRGVEGQGDQWGDYPAQEHQSGREEEHQDQVFMELLRSMWNEEEVEEDEDRGEEGGVAMEEEGRGDGVTIEDRETNEERVNEEEMEEIYEFAATQRKRDEGKESEKEESEEEEEEGGVTFFTETEEEQEAPIQAHSLAEHSDKGELTCMTSPQTKPPSLEADLAIGDIDTDRGNPNRIKTDLNKSEGRDLECSRTATMESDRTKQFESNVTSSISVGEVSTTKSLHSSPHDDQQLNASLDRSYSRLFSDSWGVYETQEEPHTSPPTQPSCQSQPPRAIQKPSRSQPPRTMVVEGARQPELTSPPPPSSRSQPTRVRVDGGTRQTAIPTLQYSAIEIIDLSISPPLVPGVSALPVPGLSPGEVTDTRARVRTERVVGGGKVPVCKELLQEKVPSCPEDLKRESHGLYSISVPVSPPHSTKEEPELIVLSDSSEEMEVGDLGPTSPSPPPPTRLSQNHQGYTRITTQSNTEPKKPTSITQSDTEPKKSSSKEKETIGGSVRDPSDQGLDPDPPGSTSLVDCSAEMSWLIPATPPLPSRRTSSSSTQTFSSMRRTQLFPKANSSSSSSAASVFSSPTLPFRPSRQTSTTSNPPRVSTHSAQTESSISRQKSDSRGLRHSSLGLDHDDRSSQKYNSGFGFTVPSKSQPKRSCFPCLTPSLSVIPPPDPSTKGTPLHNIPQPYSSTPLYSDLPKPSAPSLASPLLRDGEGDNGTRQRGRGLGISGSPWKRGGQGSLGLSLSDPSDPSSSPQKESLTQPRENSGSPGQRRPSTESKYFHSPGDRETEGEKERGVREESDEMMKMEELERSVVKEEEMEEDMERSSNSFQQSFLGIDEPPMAFDDSWGLNAGGGDTDGERSQAVCFSLRLESSGGGASPPRQGRRDGEIAGPSSTFTLSPPHPKAYTTHSYSTPSPPNTTTPQANPEINASLLDAEIWDDWGQEEDEALPLSQRVNPVALAQRVAQLKTPVAPRRKGQQGPLVPITPMPSYSDMDTPDLKNKLNRFGVRPLPKRQMILKLKEIHQYTHQVVSSESEDEAPSLGRPRAVGPPPTTSMEPTRKPVSCAQTGGFKEPSGRAAPTVSLVKLPGREEDMEPFSASQGSNTSSTAPSEDSERSNPEQCLSDDSDNDDITASQSASKLQDNLVAVRRFIQSDPDLYGQILHYQPLVLSDLQARLKAAGIRLGAAKLLDYLDSQCITFTTAKPGLRGGRRRKGKGVTRAGGRRGRGAAKTAD